MNYLLRPVLALMVVAAIASSCGDGGAGPHGLSGSINIDGSSTVFPITEAVAEEFLLVNRRVRITVGISGTGGGFQKFCAGETAIQNASRPISASELASCAAHGLEFIELPVAYDAISVVVHPKNDWVDCITVSELNKLWESGAQGKITRWNQIRASWPDREINLYGPGTDSGTFDYFTEAVNGKAKSSRGDYTASEDDNVLVQGVSGDRGSLGYLGLSYYSLNKTKLKPLRIDAGKGCVEATEATVENGAYAPLSRSLLIYVRKDEAARPEIRALIDFYLKNAAYLANDVGYVKLPDRLAAAITSRWENVTTGSLFHPAPPAGTSLEDLLLSAQR